MNKSAIKLRWVKANVIEKKHEPFKKAYQEKIHNDDLWIFIGQFPLVWR